MSLRLKLFFIFGGLIVLLVLAQWLLIRSLTGKIVNEFGEMAVTVGEGMARVFVVSEDQDSPLSLSSESEIDLTYHSIQAEHTEDGRRLIQSKHYHKTTTIEDEDINQSQSLDVKAVIKKAELHADSNSKTTTQTFVWSNDGPEPLTRDQNQLITRQGPTVLHEFQGSGELNIKLDGPENSEVHIYEGDHKVGLIPLPHTGVSNEFTKVSTYMFSGSVIILLIGLVGGGYIAHRVSQPLAQLSVAAKEVGEGALGKTIPETGGYPEIRQAVTAFNGMSLRLKELDDLATQNRNRQYLSELGEIARGLAHTIRNPLNTLGLSIEQMAALSGGREESRILLEGSQKQIRRIDQWIRSFLALASEGRGQVELLDVGGLVQDVVLEALQDNPGKARLDVFVEQDLPKIRAVPPELRAVIQALIVNAVEASPAQGQVNISVKQGHQDSIRIQITDQGKGIPEEVRNRLFTPHVTTKTYGSGMGLFLAHRLATARYRGNLQLNDLEPEGTCATLDLPKENDYDEYQDSGN